jgi:hypothetical protein
LQAPCTDNQRFFKSFEEAEFFAGLCLVLSIFSKNFKITFWLSYKQKTCYALKMLYVVGPPGSSLPKPKKKKELENSRLQALCTHNQRFFESSEEAEFFAILSLLFGIFFKKFKMAFWWSYKPKTYYALKNGFRGRGRLSK